MYKYIISIIFVIAVFGETTQAIERTLIGEKPELILHNALREPVSIQTLFSGDKTVVVFWARNNSFSTLELNDLLMLAPEDIGFNIIAVNVDRQNPTEAQIDSAVTFYSNLGYDDSLYFDFNLSNFYRLGVTAVPSTFIFDSTGTLIWALAGYLVDDRQSLVDQLLESTPPKITWRSKINPKAIRYYQLGRIMMQNSEEQMAEVNLLYASSADSSFPDPLIALSELAEKMGETDKAESLLERALDIDSTFAPAFLAKARLSFWSNDIVETLHWSTRALQSDSTNPLAYALKGWALAMKDSVSTAKESIEQAQVTGALNPMVLYVSARVWEIFDKKKLAAKMYRKSLELLLKRD